MDMEKLLTKTYIEVSVLTQLKL